GSGEVVCDQTFVAIQTPGPLSWVQVATSGGAFIHPAAPVDARKYIEAGGDVHGNRYELGDIRALPDSVVSWHWVDGVDGVAIDGASGTGWTIALPSPD